MIATLKLLGFLVRPYRFCLRMTSITTEVYYNVKWLFIFQDSNTGQYGIAGSWFGQDMIARDEAIVKAKTQKQYRIAK